MLDTKKIKIKVNDLIDNLFLELSKEYNLRSGEIEPMQITDLEQIKYNLGFIACCFVTNNGEKE